MDSFLNEIVSKSLEKAALAGDAGEIPVAAAVFIPEQKRLVSLCANRSRHDKDPSAHAEILAIREACRILNAERLDGCDLYVTLEPCPMCAAAIGFAHVRRLYFGAYDVKSGGVEHGPQIYRAPSCHYAPEVYGGIGQTKAGDLLKTFFSQLRRDDA